VVSMQMSSFLSSSAMAAMSSVEVAVSAMGRLPFANDR
jgi:hypothetical protein